MARGIARGDVRLYRFPSPDKGGPVVVLTRDSAFSYLSTVTVAPITSASRGVPSEVALGEDDGMKGPCAVNLHNTITVLPGPIGEARGPAERVAHERNLCRFALLPGLRSTTIVESFALWSLTTQAAVDQHSSARWQVRNGQATKDGWPIQALFWLEWDNQHSTRQPPICH